MRVRNAAWMGHTVPSRSNSKARSPRGPDRGARWRANRRRPRGVRSRLRLRRHSVGAVRGGLLLLGRGEVHVDGVILELAHLLRLGRGHHRPLHVDSGPEASARDELVARHLGRARAPGVGLGVREVVHVHRAEELEAELALLGPHPLRDHRRECEREGPLFVDAKRELARHHQVPHGEELRRGAREAREEARAVELLVGEGRRHDEGGRLQRGPAEHLGVHKARKAGLDLGEKLVIQARAEELEVPLVGHVHPDGLVLEPARVKGHHAAHLEGLALEVLRDLVHGQLVVVEGRVAHRRVERAALLDGRVPEGLHVARGALEEEGQRVGLERLHPDRGQRARLREAHEGKVLDVEAEVGGDDGLVCVRRVAKRLADALLRAGEHAAEHARGLAHVLGLPLDHLSGELEGRGLAVSLEGAVHLVPVSKVVRRPAGHLAQRVVDRGEEVRHLLGHGHLAARLVHRLGREVEEAVELAGRGGLRAEEAREAVHGVVPAGLAGLHLDAHAARVQNGELVGREDHQFRHHGHLEHLALLVPVPHGPSVLIPHVVGLGPHALEACELIRIFKDSIVLAHLALLGGEHRLLLARQHAAQGVEEGHRV
mmetsp:Transcript_8478/g.28861  ORF Transcript_8478/g.28861 Transcript_8478/m.28861 type:complete len:600 (-) Transcript_8478:1781-3580(-)